MSLKYRSIFDYQLCHRSHLLTNNVVNTRHSNPIYAQILNLLSISPLSGYSFVCSKINIPILSPKFTQLNLTSKQGIYKSLFEQQIAHNEVRYSWIIDQTWGQLFTPLGKWTWSHELLHWLCEALYIQRLCVSGHILALEKLLYLNWIPGQPFYCLLRDPESKIFVYTFLIRTQLFLGKQIIVVKSKLYHHQ